MTRGTLLRASALVAAGAVLGAVVAQRHPSPVRPAPARAAAPAPAASCEEAGGPASGAVRAFLGAERDGRFEDSWGLLDAASRSRYASASSWRAAAPDRRRPREVCVEEERAGPDGSVDVEVAASYRPSLDPFVGLVPGRANEVWWASSEDGAWRVSARPLSVVDVLPPETRAAEAVREWVGRLAGCDAKAGAALQAGSTLYGPADLPLMPCRERGRWTPGPVRALDDVADPQTLVAAFGPGVLTWARGVPVDGPHARFVAAVAPLGDTWRVVGVLPEQS